MGERRVAHVWLPLGGRWASSAAEQRCAGADSEQVTCLRPGGVIPPGAWQLVLPAVGFDIGVAFNERARLCWDCAMQVLPEPTGDPFAGLDGSPTSAAADDYSKYMPDVSVPSAIVAKLESIRVRREQAPTKTEIQEALTEALCAGLTVTQVAILTGIPRQQFYQGKYDLTANRLARLTEAPPRRF